MSEAKRDESEELVRRFRFLALAALADGTVAEEERKALLRQAERAGLSEEKAIDILDGADEKEFDPEPPEDVAERDALFRNILEILYADDHLSEEEDRFLNQLGERFEYSREQVDEFKADAGPVEVPEEGEEEEKSGWFSWW